jgi:L-histidine N-alpha-methyltransferase
VKDTERLERAYDDAAGITAAFNRNVLVVLNRELDGDFDPAAFAHVAFYNRDAAQIEMHLRATRTHTVNVRALSMRVPFVAGETIHTEISRKFTRASIEAMLDGGGFSLEHWYVAPGDTFALALARVNR